MKLLSTDISVFLSNHAKKALAKRLNYLFYVDES